MGRMDGHDLENLARRLVRGELSVEQFVGQMGQPMIANVGEADRPGPATALRLSGSGLRRGEDRGRHGKIFAAQLAHGIDVLATRMTPPQAAELHVRFPRGIITRSAARFALHMRGPTRPTAGTTAAVIASGRVVVVTAGTSDLPVAEEARVTALWNCAAVTLLHDVGVAGPHRLTANLPTLEQRRCDGRRGRHGRCVAERGGRVVACPVIAVPTSVGYGASFSGIAALLGCSTVAPPTCRWSTSTPASREGTSPV